MRSASSSTSVPRPGRRMRSSGASAAPRSRPSRSACARGRHVLLSPPRPPRLRLRKQAGVHCMRASARPNCRAAQPAQLQTGRAQGACCHRCSRAGAARRGKQQQHADGAPRRGRHKRARRRARLGPSRGAPARPGRAWPPRAGRRAAARRAARPACRPPARSRAGQRRSARPPPRPPRAPARPSCASARVATRCTGPQCAKANEQTGV